ncbi:hypothetical protein D3C81_1189590 [compost metagenome]
MQQAGRERVILVEADLPRQHFGAGGRRHRMAPEGLVVETGAASFREATGDGGRRDHAARRLEAQVGDRLLDGGGLHLQAIVGRVGQTQGFCRQCLVVRHFFGQHGNIDVFLVDAVEQFHDDGGQRRQVIEVGDDIVERQLRAHAASPVPRR